MRNSLHLCILALLLLTFSYLAWVGYIASDDAMYINAARQWFEHFPFIPKNHFSVRHTLNIPMGLAFQLFGFGEWQAVLITMLYFAGLVVLVYAVVRTRFREQTAFIAALLLISTPLFAVQSTMPQIDVIESFYCFLSLFLFFIASRYRVNTWLLFFSGLAAGFAFLTRETSIVLLVFYGILFLGDVYIKRQYYWIIAAGFFIPILIETCYYIAVAGDPWYRFHTVLSTQGPPTLPVLGSVSSGQEHHTYLRRLSDPLVAMFFNQEFGLLFWLAIPATWSTCLRPFGAPGQQQFLRLLLWIGLLWVFIAFYVLGLWPLARYFSVTTVTAIVIIAVWLWEGLRLKNPALVYGLLAILVVTNLVMLDLENKQPRLAERELTARLATTPSLTLYTDPKTAARAEYMMVWQGIDPGRARAEPPPPGGFYLYSRTNVLIDRGSYTFDPQRFQPKTDWIEIDRTRGKRTIIGSILNFLGIDGWLINTPMERIIWANQPVIIYRAGVTGSNGLTR